MKIQTIKRPYVRHGEALRACRLDPTLNLLQVKETQFLARAITVSKAESGDSALVEFVILCRVAPPLDSDPFRHLREASRAGLPWRRDGEC